jgi:hypothetical protein
MKHDFKGALKAITKTVGVANAYQYKDDIIFALKIADKVCGEPSDEIIDKTIYKFGDDGSYCHEIFDFMRDQILVEVEDAV